MGNRENSEYVEKNKVRELVDVEDFFQIEFVDGEPVFACNICEEGFDSETEVKGHINEKHKSLMSEDLNDTDLYKGFNKDDNRIVKNVEVEMVPWDCTLYSHLPGDWLRAAEFVFKMLTY